MKPDVEIYDTTLRDGSQGEGINFSVTDKIRIAEKLDAFGVHYIEGGWPRSNPRDLDFFSQAGRRRKPAPRSLSCATPTAAVCRAKLPASPRWRTAEWPRASASTPTTTAASAWPTPSRRWKWGQLTCREPSTATANAPATATSS